MRIDKTIRRTNQTASRLARVSGYDFLDLRVIVDRGKRCRQPQTPSVCFNFRSE